MQVETVNYNKKIKYYFPYGYTAIYDHAYSASKLHNYKEKERILFIISKKRRKEFTKWEARQTNEKNNNYSNY